MSDKPKFPHAQALSVADALVALLAPSCERIAICGSLRRGKPCVGDIEILAVPRTEMRKLDMFAEAPVDLLDEHLNDLRCRNFISRRPSVTGVFTWGVKNKLGIHWASQIPVDFFSVEARCWWVAMVIRTGSKETNLELTTTALRNGFRLHAYGGIEKLSTGETIYPESEEEVFRLCGVKYKEPKCR